MISDPIVQSSYYIICDQFSLVYIYLREKNTDNKSKILTEGSLLNAIFMIVGADAPPLGSLKRIGVLFYGFKMTYFLYHDQGYHIFTFIVTDMFTNALLQRVTIYHLDER